MENLYLGLSTRRCWSLVGVCENRWYRRKKVSRYCYFFILFTFERCCCRYSRQVYIHFVFCIAEVIVKTLLENRANATIKNRKRQSPVHVAQNVKVQRLLQNSTEGLDLQPVSSLVSAAFFSQLVSLHDCRNMQLFIQTYSYPSLTFRLPLSPMSEMM